MEDNRKIEEKALKMYADLLIGKMEEMKMDWHKPWTTANRNWMPQNLSRHVYSGINMMLLGMYSEAMRYETPVFATFKQILDEGAAVRRGEHGFPVSYYKNHIKDADGKPLTEEAYGKLSQAEKEGCSVSRLRRYYTVFNLDQTDFKAVKPEKWEKLQQQFKPDVKTEDGMMKHTMLDYMLDNDTWVCPISRVAQDRAFYTPSRDIITVPLKGQFDSGEQFYSTLLHEMAHSTGAEGRLDRDLKNWFGSHDYGREELVAELTAAITGKTLGITRNIDEENATAYLQGWINAIKEEPKFLKTVLGDVTKAGNMILDRVMSEEAQRQVIQKSIDSINEKLEENRRMRETQEANILPAGTQLGVCIGRERLHKAPAIPYGNAQPHVTADISGLEGLDENVLKDWRNMKDKINAESPETMVMMGSRDGSRYFLLGKDAGKASEVLGLQTAKTKDGMMVSQVMQHQLNDSLSRMVRAGCKVAVCDRLPSPKEVKEREIEGNRKDMQHKEDGTRQNTRLTDVTVFPAKGGGMNIRCRIDGRQMLSKALRADDARTLSEKTDRKELAARYYWKELERKEKKMGVKR